MIRDPGDIVVSTRVRLARNLENYPFRGPLSGGNGEIIDEVARTLRPLGDFSLIRMSELEPGYAECLTEKYIISPALCENTATGAVIISDDETYSVMVNEEDHLREQCILSGFRLEEAYDNLRYIDGKLSERMRFAVDRDFGYITACMSNIGTGMRASVMLFLPALTSSGKISAMTRDMKDLGLTVRGVYGEGSGAEGCLYQVSNEVTLGYSEEEILKMVGFAARKLADIETGERNNIYQRDPVAAEDSARRAYGILTNCRLLSYKEFLGLYTRVRLGIYYGFFDGEGLDAGVLDGLFLAMRPAVLAWSNAALEADRDRIRAETVNSVLTGRRRT